MKRLAIALALLSFACKKSGSDDPCTKAKPEGPFAWIADDYPAALACAKQRKVPLVIDLWAPWCHTCLSMQSTVFMDPSFATDKDRFVFVALDTDREINAAPLTKLSISAWPTFYVLDHDEAVLARFIGSSSVEQFHAFLDAGARANVDKIAGADARLLGAERALTAKDYATADEELTAALAAAPETWPRRPDVLGSLILTKLRRNDFAGCVELAEANLDKTGNAAVASDFLVSAMTCAEQRSKDEPDRVKALRERAIARWQQVLADPAAPLSVDDRSDAMASQRETLEALGKTDEARALAEQQRAILDDAAAMAPNPMAAMTYNYQRAEVYVYLGRPLDLVPALEKSAKDLPSEYDPRARLGSLLLRAGKLDEAAKWTDEALKLAYGPRKGRVLGTRADIAKQAGDKAAEKKFRIAAVELYESLAPGQQSPEALAKAKEALAAIDSGAAPAKP
jgi:thioredoxin-like negative regulator of GroEL